MKLILVEDDDGTIGSCQNAVDDFREDHGCEIVLDPYKDVDSARTALRNSYYDGAIIDINLGNSGIEESEGGNKIIAEIRDALTRLPVVIVTGTPDGADAAGVPLVQICKKGEIEYKDVIESFWNIYKTGITKIMGGTGEIEKCLSEIFINSLLPQIKSEIKTTTGGAVGKQLSPWEEYAVNEPENTEKSLLRHTLSHLIQHLDCDAQKYYPEEMYLYKTNSKRRVNTGGILKRKSDSKYFVVMSPACDLADRGQGTCKTDKGLLVELEPVQKLNEISEIEKSDITSNKKEKQKTDILKKIRKNNKNLYYHWLPRSEHYEESVVNFRWLSTHSADELKNDFEVLNIRISPPFLKDMISRFSSYYARQGQPEIIMGQ